MLERWLLRRPQLFVDVDLVAADDATRSQSAHSLASSGIALLVTQSGASLDDALVAVQVAFALGRNR